MLLRSNVDISGTQFNNLQLLSIYTYQNQYFTSNPEYSLFYKYTKCPDKRETNKDYHRHTHFITTNYIVKSELNEFNLYINGSAVEIIYDIILETTIIPTTLYLCCNNIEYLIDVHDADIHKINDKYYTKIPLKRYNIDYINLGFDHVIKVHNDQNSKGNVIKVNSKGNDQISKGNDQISKGDHKYIDDFKKTKLKILSGEHDNPVIYIYGVILNSEERKRLYHYLPFYNYSMKDVQFNKNNKETVKKSITSDHGTFTIKNTFIQNVSIETPILPKYIKIDIDSISETLSIDDLLCYNKIYEDTITETDNKFTIKIPILFNQHPILAFDNIIVKISIDIKNTSTLHYESNCITLSDINKLLEKTYPREIIVKYFKHKKICLEETNKKYIDLDDFKFPLKELFFTGNFNNQIDLQYGYHKCTYNTINTRITNHVSAFEKVIDNYNLISFCVDSKTDFTGEFMLKKEDDFLIFLDTLTLETNDIDICGIGYKIIQYNYVNEKFCCKFFDE